MKAHVRMVLTSAFVLICLGGLGARVFAQTWIQLAPTGGPPPTKIFGASVIYDPPSNRLILFGGNDGSAPTNDVWVLTNANGLGGVPAWTQLSPTGGPPAPRDNHVAVYDPSSNSMIIFGGCAGGCLPALNDVWVLTNANGLGGTPAWTQLSPSGTPPASRIGMGSAYDPASNELIIFGGQDGGGFAGATFPEVWVLTNANGLGGTSAWTSVPFSGGPPPGQYRLSSSFDKTNNRLIVAGGDANGTGLPSNAVWVLADANDTGSIPTWTNLIAENPAGRPPDFDVRPAAFDPATGRMIVVGDARDGTTNFDVWLASNANGISGPSSWTQLLPTGGPPLANSGAEGAAYDSASNRLVVFFSVTQNSATTNQLWVLTDANGSPNVPISIFNTGVASDGTLLPAGVIDPHYTVAPPGSATGPAFVVQPTGLPLCVGVACPWLPDGPNSNWIDPFGPIPSGPIPVGNYIYTTTFDLTGLNPATAALTGQWISDNNGVQIVLNGNIFPFTTPFNSYIGPFVPFAINSGFVPGVNTLQLVVFEDGSITGLRAEVSGTAQSQVSATSTALTSSANPSVFGQLVTFTATVTPASGSGTPTGTVSFNDGALTLATATLSSGQASFATSLLSVGSHSITAVYNGDSNFTGSTSVALTQTVNMAPTTTALTSSPSPSVFGQSVTFTVAVSVVAPGAGTPTGTVTFNDGSTALATVMLTSSGTATFSTSSLAVNSHSITAVYSGDSNFTGSTSAALTQAVNKASTTTALSCSPNPSIVNQSVTFTATVSLVAPGAGTPTGTVTFNDGSTTLTTVTLTSSGTATFSTSSLAVNSHSITAVYSGDGNFNGSSGSLTQNAEYSICVLYDQSRAVHGGATFPIKVALCDVNGVDVSSSVIVLHATAVTVVSGFSGTPGSPGNANPDSDFRFDSTLGATGGYIFNLSTGGLAPGSYSLQFTAGTDAIPHTVMFGVAP